MNKCSLPSYDAAKCVFFALGRNAIYTACQAMGLKAGDEVLTPAFDCDGALQPFKALGLKIKFYRSDPYTFSADIPDLRRRVGPNTRLVHVINHFGMPQPWDELSVFRNEAGIPILEDNAYSLFSRYNGRPFGSFGDMSVFSLRKNLLMTDGGMLRVNNPEYEVPFVKKDAAWCYPTEYAVLLRLMAKKTGVLRALKPLVRPMFAASNEPPPLYSDPAKGYPDWPLRDTMSEDFLCDFMRPISRLAAVRVGGLSQDELAGIAKGKRSCYKWLSDALDGLKGIKVLWPELPEGVVPFCLSILADSDRDRMLTVLRKRYDVMAWPTLSGLVLDHIEDYPEMDVLGRKLLQVNLPSDRVVQRSFPGHLEDLVRDIKLFLMKS